MYIIISYDTASLILLYVIFCCIGQHSSFYRLFAIPVPPAFNHCIYYTGPFETSSAFEKSARDNCSYFHLLFLGYRYLSTSKLSLLCSIRDLLYKTHVASQETVSMHNEQPRIGTRHGIVVFSGGSAANSLVDVFNDIAEKHTKTLSYVIPISDNGGSTSELIRVLGGPGA